MLTWLMRFRSSSPFGLFGVLDELTPTNRCCRRQMFPTYLFHGKVLGERDLEPVMTKMREQLMSRNVASEVANDITASVQATLLNQKLKSFTR